jgi:hypothetical protein
MEKHGPVEGSRGEMVGEGSLVEGVEKPTTEEMGAYEPAGVSPLCGPRGTIG